jgi:cardiolipin hydrolase
MEEIIRLFEESFKQKAFSPKDKSDIARLLAQQKIHTNTRGKNILTQQLFDICRSEGANANVIEVVNWLEEAMRVLRTNAPATDASFNKAYFNPHSSCFDATLNRLNSAKESMKICMFTISDDRVAKALLRAHSKGVKIKIITDNDKIKDLGSDILRLAKAGIEILMDDTPNHMHHKFVVIDRQILITGSYNWTRSAADFNHENLLITDNPRIVSPFIQEFEKLWEEMKIFPVRHESPAQLEEREYRKRIVT